MTTNNTDNAITNINEYIKNNDIHGLTIYFKNNHIKPSLFNNNENIIKSLIKTEKNNILKFIFNSYKFDNNFIINLLNFYKNKNLTPSKLKCLITEENNKIIITNDMYDLAFKHNNFMALKILFENEIINKKKALRRIIKYNLIENSIKTNDYNFVSNILSYKNFNYKNLKYEEIIITAIKNNKTSNSILNNNKNIAKLLIKSSLKTSNSTCPIKNLILNIAIKSKNFDIVQYLIENKEFKYTSEELNSKDLKGEYPIITALSKNFEIFDYLLDKGVDYNSKNNNDIPLIFLAIYRNDIDAVYSLINDQTQNKISIDILDKNGYTPLIYAYINKLMEIFNYLLEYSDINLKDRYGHNILYYVIQNNDSVTIKYLIDIGAKIGMDDMKNAFYKPILSTILDYDDIPLNYVNDEGQPLLISIIKNKCQIYDCVEKLIKKGCNINVQDKKGNTPLIYATKNETVDVVKLLIKYGAIKNITNLDGNRAIDFVPRCDYKYSNLCKNYKCNHQKLRNMLNHY